MNVWRRSPLLVWFCVALVFRFICSLTHFNWNHPDEWYQTVEFASLFVRGFAAYSQELDLHLRNMTWPLILTVPLKVAQWIAPNSARARIFSFQFFTGLLDLGLLWGWARLARSKTLLKVKANDAGEMLSLGLLVFFPMWPVWMEGDSFRPSIEHVAAVSTWITLGLLSSGNFMGAGILSVFTGAVKYPAGLISLGVLTSVWIQASREGDSLKLKQFLVGAGIGAITFGIPDWCVYGRPWESLWMYLQYNVFSGASSHVFGHQSASVYLTFFYDRWFKPSLLFFPFGVLAVSFALLGLTRDLLKRRCEPWSLAALFYGFGHLWTPHKEARFMAPIEGLLLWGALRAAQEIISMQGSNAIKKWGSRLGLFLWIGNGFLLLRLLWGETWAASGTYFEADYHRKEAGNPCGLVTVRSPEHLGSMALTDLPTAYFASDRHEVSFLRAQKTSLQWIEKVPECRQDQKILLHLHRPDPDWVQRGCELRPSGLLAFWPKSHWHWPIQMGWARGSWYECPSSVLGVFKAMEVYPRFTLAHQIKSIPTLPRFGVSAEDLNRLIQRKVPSQ